MGWKRPDARNSSSAWSIKVAILVDSPPLDTSVRRATSDIKEILSRRNSSTVARIRFISSAAVAGALSEPPPAVQTPTPPRGYGVWKPRLLADPCGLESLLMVVRLLPLEETAIWPILLEFRFHGALETERLGD